MTRVRIALAAVIVTALLPGVMILSDVLSNPAVLRRRDDPLSLFERHLAPLRQALRGTPRVGYLAPESLPGDAHLYSVRYALAPVMVLNNADQPLVIADGVTAATRIPPHLRVQRNFGDGLLLLEAVPPGAAGQ